MSVVAAGQIPIATDGAVRSRPNVPHGKKPLGQRPHALYRFYDARRRLLYVGITAALPTRLNNHNDEKPWWTEVVDIKVEHFPDRDSVLSAEKAAIVAEKPLHNVVHNQGHTVRPTTRGNGKGIPGIPTWTFRSRYGYKNVGQLWLYWEVECDPISDDWCIDEISPEELWEVWLTKYPRDEHTESVFGPGTRRISWFIGGEVGIENAPFQDWRGVPADLFLTGPDGPRRDFLQYYTRPVNPETGDPLQWSRLPVIDKVWRHDNLPDLHDFKGGFIQEATGWKPAPLQPYVDVYQLARMAGLYTPGPHIREVA